MILFLWTSVYVAVWYSVFKICIKNIFHAIYFEHILPPSQLPNHSFKKQTRKEKLKTEEEFTGQPTARLRWVKDPHRPAWILIVQAG